MPSHLDTIRNGIAHEALAKSEVSELEQLSWTVLSWFIDNRLGFIAFLLTHQHMVRTAGWQTWGTRVARYIVVTPHAELTA